MLTVIQECGASASCSKYISFYRSNS